MSCSADAELVYGLPVRAYEEATADNDYDPDSTPFWSTDDEYWRYGEIAPLELVTFGHYENIDDLQAILTLKRIPRYRGDCWEPTRIEASRLLVSREDQTSAQKAMDKHGLPGDFYQAAWYLVASYG